MRHGSLDRFDQLMSWKWLMQKCHAAGLDCLVTDGFVIKRRHEDDWKVRMGPLQLPPQFNAGQAVVQVNVHEKTIGLRRSSAAKEFLGR